MPELRHSSTLTQEAEHIRAGLPLGIMLWVLLFGALLCAVAGILLGARVGQLEHAPPTAAPAAAPVQAGVRPEPNAGQIRTDLIQRPGAGDALKARQRAALERYHWVDRERGIVRIPIDVAIELELQEVP